MTESDTKIICALPLNEIFNRRSQFELHLSSNNGLDLERNPMKIPMIFEVVHGLNID